MYIFIIIIIIFYILEKKKEEERKIRRQSNLPSYPKVDKKDYRKIDKDKNLQKQKNIAKVEKHNTMKKEVQKKELEKKSYDSNNSNSFLIVEEVKDIDDENKANESKKDNKKDIDFDAKKAFIYSEIFNRKY